MAAGQNHALRRVSWNRLEKDVSSPGQPWPLLPSQGLPCSPHCQHLEDYTQYKAQYATCII